MKVTSRKPREIRPAERYADPKDLWVVSTFFDSEGYYSKLRALRAYRRTMNASGIPMLLVEGAFGKNPFLLPESDRILRVRCPSVMWQKERLLNVGIEHLPQSCRKVAWLDTDIFFENPRWAVETSALLDMVPVVQPFDTALWLPIALCLERFRLVIVQGRGGSGRSEWRMKEATSSGCLCIQFISRSVAAHSSSEVFGQ